MKELIFAIEQARDLFEEVIRADEEDAAKLAELFGVKPESIYTGKMRLMKIGLEQILKENRNGN